MKYNSIKKINIKKINILLMAVLLLFGCQSAAVYAEEEGFTVYNKGEIVELENPIIENENGFYIAYDSLEDINLEYDAGDFGFSDTVKFQRKYGDGKNRSILHIEENLIYGVEDFHENASVYSENKLYISLDAMAAEYSEEYSVDREAKIINLWINDYTTETFTAKITLPEGVVVPEEGFELTMYSDRALKGASSGGGTGIIISGSGLRINKSEYLGYDGTAIDEVLSQTELIDTDMSVLEEKKVTIPYGENSATVKFDIEVRDDRGYPLSAYYFYIGYVIDNDGYIGSGRVSVSEKKTNVSITAGKCYARKYITGTVTVPEHSGELEYTIVAEGNRTAVEKENGSLKFDRDYVFKTSGTIPAGETSAEYSIMVIPNVDYYVSIAFDGKEYIRKNTEIEALAEDTVVDFNSFEESRKVTGTIKLPEDIEWFVEIKGDVLTEVSGDIRLQSAKAPYYYLDTYYFDIDTEEKSAEFVLIDDVGVESAVVYFSLWHDIKNLYGMGNYKDDTTSVANVKYATAIPTDSKNICVNVQKGRVVQAMMRCPDGEPEFDVRFIVQDEDGTIKTAEESELALYGETEAFYDVDGMLNYEILCTLPENAERYILQIDAVDFDETLYISESGATKDISSAKVYPDEYVEFSYSGYEPEIPLRIEPGKYAEEANLLYFYIHNDSELNYDNTVEAYVVLYDEEGCVSSVIQDKYSVEQGIRKRCDVELAAEDYAEAANIKVLLWRSDIRPFAEAFSAKTTE